MSSPIIATQSARRLASSVPARGHLLHWSAALSLVCACSIDDRTLQNGSLTLIRADAGDAGLDAGDAGAGEGTGADTTLPTPGSGEPPEPADPAEPGTPAEPRPIRALGDAVSTGLVGGSTGTDDRARCVEGVLVGFDYAFNDAAHPQFPSRLTFVRPVCATPVVVDDALDLSAPGALAWSVVGGDDGSLVRPDAARPLRCPEGYGVVGLTGSVDEVGTQLFAVRELEIDCAPLAVQDGRVDIVRGPVASVAAERFSATPGAVPVEVACGDGTTAATGAIVRWGSWLDGVGLQCSRLIWPFSAGQGCALNEDCQSGVCESFATCAP
jgi:hypothetical protein